MACYSNQLTVREQQALKLLPQLNNQHTQTQQLLTNLCIAQNNVQTSLQHAEASQLYDKGQLQSLQSMTRQLLGQVRAGQKYSDSIVAHLPLLPEYAPIKQFQDKLDEQHSNAEGIQRQLHERSWKLVLRAEFASPNYQSIVQYVQGQRANGIIVYPPDEEVFEWMRHCFIEDVRVVILGQDPYYKQAGQAHGLAFSVKPPQVLPPSLKNIYKALYHDLRPHFQNPGDGDLTGWAKQGVLLLNCFLTVQHGERESHSRIGWEIFTDAVIRHICQRPNVVFMLWGNDAKDKAKRIEELKEDTGICCTIFRPNAQYSDEDAERLFLKESRVLEASTQRHLVLSTSHPSRLSARLGYSNCKHFSLANKWLEKHNLGSINWNALYS